ncbi:cupin domain-containing protein [Candidatus Binatia bacterium]|nr:cupin domain-containing protein [Candidatus Binatia bacterium]
MDATSKATFRAPGEGPVHRVLGMRHHYKATARDTAGAYVSFEIEIPPGCGAPPHHHAVDSESFYVLDGEICFSADGTSRVARRGDFVLLPAGGVHAFANTGTAPARALVVAAPGIEAERFFAAIDARADDVPSPGEVTEIAARHGLTILPLPVA